VTHGARILISVSAIKGGIYFCSPSCCFQDYVTSQQRGFRQTAVRLILSESPLEGKKLIPQTSRLRWLPEHIPGISPHCILCSAGPGCFLLLALCSTTNMPHLRLVYDSCRASYSLPRGYILSSFLGATLTFLCFCWLLLPGG